MWIKLISRKSRIGKSPLIDLREDRFCERKTSQQLLHVVVMEMTVACQTMFVYIHLDVKAVIDELTPSIETFCQTTTRNLTVRASNERFRWNDIILTSSRHATPVTFVFRQQANPFNLKFCCRLNSEIG